MTEEKLTHIDEKGDVRMVDVSQKADTERIAVAEGFISMKPETLELITSGTAAKGDVLACARVAGVMAAKKTSELIPMCHPLMITKAKVSCEPVLAGEREDGRVGIHITTTCGVTGKTGIEMEALTAASVACLTVYDMCKAVDRGMEIMDVRLLKKDGGKTGLWERKQRSMEPAKCLEHLAGWSPRVEGIEPLFIVALAGHHVARMAKCVHDAFPIFARGFFAARKIDDERVAALCGDGARQHCVRRDL